MNIETVIIAIAAMIAVASALFAAYQINQSLRSTERRLLNLESNAMMSNAKRHTHATTAGIEDATAVAIDLLIKQKADTARIETLLKILGSVRQGPHAYDPERPAGPRPEGFEE